MCSPALFSMHTFTRSLCGRFGWFLSHGHKLSLGWLGLCFHTIFASHLCVWTGIGSFFMTIHTHTHISNAKKRWIYVVVKTCRFFVLLHRPHIYTYIFLSCGIGPVVSFIKCLFFVVVWTEGGCNEATTMERRVNQTMSSRKLNNLSAVYRSDSAWWSPMWLTHRFEVTSFVCVYSIRFHRSNEAQKNKISFDYRSRSMTDGIT